MSNKLEQLEFKLEKNIGIKKHAGKVRKHFKFLLFPWIHSLWIQANFNDMRH